MKTPIDHYIDDAVDGIFDRDGIDDVITDGYQASRDIGEEPLMDEGLTTDIAFRRRSFEDNPDMQPDTDGNVQIGNDGIEVEMIQGIDEPNFKRVCAEAIARVTGADPADVEWEEMLRGGLQTALETQVVVFGVRGVSRACTHQLVRTRKAAFHQQSQRSSYYGPHPEVRLANSVWDSSRARAAALRAVYFAHKAYETAIEEDISYQDARLILPEGTTNWIMCEYPLRVWLDTYAYRGCSMFQWEIVHVFREMRRLLVEAYPWLEPYAKISCEKTHGALDTEEFMGQSVDLAKITQQPVDVSEAVAHACTFQGHERVDEQCLFPWARETNRTFKPEEDHKIGPKS